MFSTITSEKKKKNGIGQITTDGLQSPQAELGDGLPDTGTASMASKRLMANQEQAGGAGQGGSTEQIDPRAQTNPLQMKEQPVGFSSQTPNVTPSTQRLNRDIPGSTVPFGIANGQLSEQTSDVYHRQLASPGSQFQVAMADNGFGSAQTPSMHTQSPSQLPQAPMPQPQVDPGAMPYSDRTGIPHFGDNQYSRQEEFQNIQNSLPGSPAQERFNTNNYNGMSQADIAGRFAPPPDPHQVAQAEFRNRGIKGKIMGGLSGLLTGLAISGGNPFGALSGGIFGAMGKIYEHDRVPELQQQDARQRQSNLDIQNAQGKEQQLNLQGQKVANQRLQLGYQQMYQEARSQNQQAQARLADARIKRLDDATLQHLQDEVDKTHINLTRIASKMAIAGVDPGEIGEASGYNFGPDQIKQPEPKLQQRQTDQGLIETVTDKKTGETSSKEILSPGGKRLHPDRAPKKGGSGKDPKLSALTKADIAERVKKGELEKVQKERDDAMGKLSDDKKNNSTYMQFWKEEHHYTDTELDKRAEQQAKDIEGKLEQEKQKAEALEKSKKGKK